ncbi:hypothetical protein K491DRAFT_295718 [Lophiostoma macrostomum CBS 122681]|uniref:Uncharacterized protein n=1 Tax=Lophiostoma macrostomum CBS 122681 TaxID=1314788 RepID=A0A6A6THK2_9PLEO|nr:hypothetical protein K491DRAFT_295718 [Lophiostoma macrostomum CBS 122681]
MHCRTTKLFWDTYPAHRERLRLPPLSQRQACHLLDDEYETTQMSAQDQDLAQEQCAKLAQPLNDDDWMEMGTSASASSDYYAEDDDDVETIGGRPRAGPAARLPLRRTRDVKRSDLIEKRGGKRKRMSDLDVSGFLDESSETVGSNEHKYKRVAHLGVWGSYGEDSDADDEGSEDIREDMAQHGGRASSKNKNEGGTAKGNTGSATKVDKNRYLDKYR